MTTATDAADRAPPLLIVDPYSNFLSEGRWT
jgi:hypothetical protein